jgi:hypothetical protein
MFDFKHSHQYQKDRTIKDFQKPGKKGVGKKIFNGDLDVENEIYTNITDQWSWESQKNNPYICKYIKTPGLSNEALDQIATSRREIDFFNLLFDDSFWENIVQETNKYADQIRKDVNLKKALDESWDPVDCNEIKVYFALCIIMTQVKKSKISMNWSKRAIIETPIFQKCMSRNRFTHITRVLHFSDNEASDPKVEFGKLMPIVDYFNSKFKQLYVMEKDVSIDESLMKFKGRIRHKIFNPSKRARFGIKYYKLCESISGYCYSFKIYAGNDNEVPEFNTSEAVVIDLMKPIINNGHTLFVDNWYSSPKLFYYLSRNGTKAPESLEPPLGIGTRIGIFSGPPP